MYSLFDKCFRLFTDTGATNNNFSQTTMDGANPTKTGPTSNLGGIAGKFKTAMNNIVGPILIVIGAAAAIYCIYLGVMYAKAEDANKRKEVQGRLIGAAIGVVIIIVGITLCYAVNWEGLVTQFQSDSKV